MTTNLYQPYLKELSMITPGVSPARPTAAGISVDVGVSGKSPTTPDDSDIQQVHEGNAGISVDVDGQCQGMIGNPMRRCTEVAKFHHKGVYQCAKHHARLLTYDRETEQRSVKWLLDHYAGKSPDVIGKFFDVEPAPAQPTTPDLSDTAAADVNAMYRAYGNSPDV